VGHRRTSTIHEYASYKCTSVLLATSQPVGREEDRCSAAKNAESSEPASRNAERSARLETNRPVTKESSPPLLLVEAALYKRSFLRCSSGTLSFPERLWYSKDDKYLLYDKCLSLRISTSHKRFVSADNP
jgi:hypothetical protein